MLEMEEATFLYAPGRGIAGASFRVVPGEVVGVVGGNGAGKSTLLGLAAAALVPQVGQVMLAVTDLGGRTKRFRTDAGIAYRRRVGYLTEQAPLYEEMGVAQYLRFRARLRGERFLRIRRRVREAMERCGLIEVRRERIGALSFGFRRRVALAEAILTMPSVLVLDDPFSGVDAQLRAELATVIRDVSGRAHVLLSGHDPLLLAACCTRFLVVEHGRLIADEGSAEVALTAVSGVREEGLVINAGFDQVPKGGEI